MFRINYLSLTKAEVARISDNKVVKTFEGTNAKVAARQFVQDQYWEDTRTVAA